MDGELLRLVLSLILLSIGCIMTCALYWVETYVPPIIRLVASLMVFVSFLAWGTHNYEDFCDAQAEQSMLEFSQGIPEGEYLEGLPDYGQ